MDCRQKRTGVAPSAFTFSVLCPLVHFSCIVTFWFLRIFSGRDISRQGSPRFLNGLGETFEKTIHCEEQTNSSPRYEQHSCFTKTSFQKINCY